MAWKPGDKPIKAPELAQEVMGLVRQQMLRLAERVDQADLVRSKELRAIVSDLIILADMAKGVFEHLPRVPTEDDEPKE